MGALKDKRKKPQIYGALKKETTATQKAGEEDDVKRQSITGEEV